MEGNADPVSDSQTASSKRLPVNPRRHKVAPEQRKRVVRACNACNNRRVKCTGEQPCQRCVKTSRDCEYTASDTDRTSLKDELERLRVRCSVLEDGLKTIAPHQAPDLLHQVDRGEPPTWSSVIPFPASILRTNETDEAGGRLLHDPDGTVRYLGESSGATFIDQLKHFMRTLVVPLTDTVGSGDYYPSLSSVGHYQTFDSRPLPNPDVDPTWLPSKPDMVLMLQELRQYIQDGRNGEFVSGGIAWWGDLNSLPIASAGSTSIVALTTKETHRHLAFHHVCFALSVVIGHTPSRLSEHQSGEAYFKRARLLLGNPLDTVRFSLSDVPALVLMGYYLIEVNRRDAAYMYVSLAVHIAIIHGSFRHTVDEASKRTFWTLYIMDRWFSMLMGRPPVIPDEAIRLPRPVDAPSMPPSVGLCAHIELATISGYIVCECYGIAPRHPKTAGSEASIDFALGMLHDWQARLPIKLQIPVDQSLLDPACCTMHMHYNQLIILTTRPVFFTAIKKVVAQRIFSELGSTEGHPHEAHARSCIEAAQRNLELAQLLQSKNQNWLQSGLHFLFNAAVVLLLSRISSAREINVDLNRASDGPHAAEIRFAIHVFEQEAKTGTNYPRDCCKMLQDLKALTDRYVITQHMPNLQRPAVDPNLDLPIIQPAAASSASLRVISHGTNNGPNAYQEMMSWAQTDGPHSENNLLI